MTTTLHITVAADENYRRDVEFTAFTACSLGIIS